MKPATDQIAQITERLKTFAANNQGKHIGLGLCAVGWAIAYAADRIAEALEGEKE